MRILLLFMGLFFCLTRSSFGQLYPNVYNATPVSPEVAALGKYIDIPMDLSTGLPQISLPIYTAKSGMLEVPITLNYNASGIKVEEGATWVGLGWNLSTGPSLTRVVKGTPDNGTNGLMNPGFSSELGDIYSIKKHMELKLWTPEGLLHPEGEIKRLLEADAYPGGGIDIAADIFSFTLLGYSGKFMWNQETEKFILFPQQNIDIEFLGNTIVLTLPNGVQAFFGGQTENVTNALLYNYTKEVHAWDASFSSNPSFRPYVSAWPIQKLRDPNGHEIQFEYTMEFSVEEYGRSGEVMSPYFTGYQDAPLLGFTAGIYKQYFNKPVLSKIIAESCEIHFVQDATSREDVVFNIANSGKSLDKIVVFINDLEFTTFQFNYSYFESGDNFPYIPILFNPLFNAYKKRLKLLSVQEKNTLLNIEIPPYTFEYNSTQLPNRFSASQDYWGFYNGRENGVFLTPRIPRYHRNTITYEITDNLFEGYLVSEYLNADRRISPSHTQACILTKINNPLGGYTEYYYEPNSVPATQFSAKSYLERSDLISKSSGKFMPVISEEPPYNTIYTHHPFIVGRLASKLKVNADFPCNSVVVTADCPYSFKIRRVSDGSVVHNIILPNTEFITLPEDEYIIECVYDNTLHPNDPPEFTVEINWNELPPGENMMVGGLRISKIKSHDGLGNFITRAYSYNMPFSENSDLSSGWLAAQPFHSRFTIHRDGLGQSLSNPNHNGNNGVLQFLSNSAIPFSGDGQLVRYRYVTEYLDEVKASYKTVYAFLVDFNLPFIKFGDLNSGEYEYKTWYNGMNLGRKAYKKSGEEDVLVQETTINFQKYDEEEGLFGLDPYQFVEYYKKTDRLEVVSETTIDYDGTTDNPLYAMQTTKTYEYNDKRQISKVILQNSKGQIAENISYYPNDFNDIPGTTLAALKQKNIITLPVQQFTTVDGVITSGLITNFNENGMPVKIYSYESDQANTVQHTPSQIGLTNFYPKVNLQYSATGSIVQVADIKGPTQIYFWGKTSSGKELVLAAVQNATIDKTAYATFDYTEASGWYISGGNLTTTESFSGAAYNINGGRLFTGSLSLGRYIVQYWSKSGSKTVTGTISSKVIKVHNGWSLYEHTVENTSIIEITGSGLIDDVILMPSDAQIVIYKYDLYNRLKSKTDQNRNTTYYDYDGFGRLLFVSDDDENILNKYEYKIQ